MSLHEASDFLLRPTPAVASSLLSVVVSMLPAMEQGMRLFTLACGMTIALLAVRKAWRDRDK